VKWRAEVIAWTFDDNSIKCRYYSSLIIPKPTPIDHTVPHLITSRPGFIRGPEMLALQPSKHGHQESQKRDEAPDNSPANPILHHPAKIEVELCIQEVHIPIKIGHAKASVQATGQLETLFSKAFQNERHCGEQRHTTSIEKAISQQSDTAFAKWQKRRVQRPGLLEKS